MPSLDELVEKTWGEGQWEGIEVEEMVSGRNVAWVMKPRGVAGRLGGFGSLIAPRPRDDERGVTDVSARFERVKRLKDLIQDSPVLLSLLATAGDVLLLYLRGGTISPQNLEAIVAAIFSRVGAHLPAADRDAAWMLPVMPPGIPGDPVPKDDTGEHEPLPPSGQGRPAADPTHDTGGEG